MKIVRTGLQFVLAWVALIAGQMIAGMFITIKVQAAPHLLRWMLVSDALIVLALGFAALRSDWHGWKLFAALFGIPVAINLTNLIEGVVFLGNIKMDWRGLTELTVVAYVIAAAAWVLIFRSRPVVEANGGMSSHSVLQGIGLYAASSLLYLVCYFIAGMIIFPFVRDFYATQTVPSTLEVASLQFFVRGPIFVAICLALMRMVRMSGAAGALAVGLMFTVMTGVAPLILPNALFPDSVRWVHFCEVTSSNFVFAAGVAWLWGKAQPSHRTVTALA